MLIEKHGSVNELFKLFEKDITVKAIYEKLYFVYFNDNASEVKNYLIEKHYDLAGIAESESKPICGYIKTDDLKGGLCKDYVINFDIEEIASDSTPLIEVFKAFLSKEYLFILENNRIKYIVTKADLQKPAVKIFIFGLINLLEINFTKIINKIYPNDSWVNKISENRLNKAKELLSIRKNKNEDLSLLDCLEFADKRDLILKFNNILEIFDSKSKNNLEKKLRKIEDLRDLLAHAQNWDLEFSWIEIINIILDIKNIIIKCEYFLNS